MARIVFDLDGTLIDSAADIHGVANAVLAAEGLEPITAAESRSFIGNGTPTYVARLRAARAIPEGEQERLLAAFLDRYDGAVALTPPYAGVPEALALLARAHRLGICTNKPERPARAVLRHLGLDGLFGTVIGGDSTTAHKPDPAPLHAAFKALGEGPRLYVGDSEVDAETADRAGVPFLHFTGGYDKGGPMVHAGAFGDWAEMPGLVGNLARA